MSVVDRGAIAATQSSHRELDGGRVRLSGIMARDVDADVQVQTRDALGVVDQRLAELGLDRSALLAVHIWLKEMSLFQGMTTEWNSWIGNRAPPSRSCVSGSPIVPGALLELEVIAARPRTMTEGSLIERYGLVRGPGRPTMCLALRHGDWFTVCTLASDRSVGIDGQTQQILDVFDGYMEDAGVARSDACRLEIWLKNMGDLDAVNDVLEAWFAPGPLPAASIVAAHMASGDMLIEIRLTATVREASSP